MNDPTDIGVRDPATLPGPRYLGDGVYASHDGYQIWLHLNDHRSPGIIALDRDVFCAVKAYGEEFYGRR